jgi:hypothetical protein
MPTDNATPAKRDRSPSFPYLGLAKALERLTTLFDKAKRHEVRVADVAKDWGLTAKSSSLDRNVAALLAYGLIEDSGSGEARKIKISDAGLRILEDKRPGVREKLLADAALKPRIIAEYAQLWKDGRPDEAHTLSLLKFEGNFTDEGARMFLRVFDETIAFANSGKTESSADNTHGHEPDPAAAGKVSAQIGDTVQWTSQGVDQFPLPKKVIQISEDARWIWVEGSATGIPIDEVQVVTKAFSAPPAMPPIPNSGIQLAGGEREWLRGPLSGQTSYRLLIDGEMGPKEIGKLIRLLEAQKVVLEDE